MRICDFCWNTLGHAVPAVTQISFGPSEQPDDIADSCQSCAALAKETLNKPRTEPEAQEPIEPLPEAKRGAGRPRKAS